MNNHRSSIRVIADAPSKTDLLGFSSSINALLTVITSPRTVTPFTVGVLGDWGIGKSTMMMQLADKLTQNNYPVVVFNPWKYDGREEVLNALVQTILLTFSENEDRKRDEDTIKTIIGSFGRMIASSAVSHITGGVVDLDKVIEDYSNMSTTRVEFINRFEAVFGQLVNEYAGDERLVIFIDDLDRCVPENVIKVLESIKLFLSVPKCIFVIGLEQEVIQEGIRHRYGDKLGFSGKDYLEKIIQLPFKVPTPSEKNVTDFINYLAGENVSKSVRHIAVQGSESNPRRIKRFLNSFEILQEILVLEEKDSIEPHALNNTILAFVLMLEIRFPELYFYFSNNLKDCNQLLELFLQGKFFDREQIDRISTTNRVYADLLNQVVFQRFARSMISIGKEFSLGDEGLVEYFTVTRTTSAMSPGEDLQQYFLPELKAHGNIINFSVGKRDLILTSFGNNKIAAIKAVRGITGLGVKEAKEFVENTPQVLMEGVSPEEAQSVIQQLRKEGVTAELK